MKILAAMEVDLEVTPIGTRSRLAQELAGETVLRRTVDQVRRMRHVAALHVRCPDHQVQRCRTLLDGTDAVVRPRAVGPPPWASGGKIQCVPESAPVAICVVGPSSSRPGRWMWPVIV